MLFARGANAQAVSYEPGAEGEIWQQLSTLGPAAPGCMATDTNFLCSIRPGGPVCDVVTPDPPGLPFTVCGDPAPPDQMKFPIAVVIEQTGSGIVPAGTAFVTDQSNDRVRVFLPDGTLTQLPHPIGAPGTPVTAPEGIAIDAAHQIIVAASFDSSVNVYAPDGALRYKIWPGGIPTGIAISPGTTITGGNGLSPNPADHQGTLVITDKYSSKVHIYDANGKWLRTIGSLPSGAGNGSFSAPSGAAFDRTGQHLMIADIESPWTQIFDATGTTLQMQFQSVDGQQRSYAAAFDHKGRAIVSDTSGQRLAFYQLDFTARTATQIFALDARGDLNGYPRGVSEFTVLDPVNPSLAIDERILVVDTTNHRVQRFQIPNLAAISLNITPPPTPASAGTVTFRVAVPDTKPSVASVMPILTPSGATVTGPIEPAPINIGTGQAATFTFNYMRTGTRATFVASAVGNPVTPSSQFPDGYATHAKTLAGAETIPCVGCGSTATVTAPVASPSGWYRGPTTVALSGTGGTTQIFYQFVNCPEAAVTRGPHSVPAAGGTLTITTEGLQTLAYWGVDATGAEEVPHKILTMKVDFTPPSIFFGFPSNFTVDPRDGTQWYNRNTSPVQVTWGATDSTSGIPATFTATPLSFPNEGRGQSLPVTAADVAGNSITIQSNDAVRANGMNVNVDRTPPTLTVPTGALRLEANTLGGFSFSLTPSITAVIPGLSATDPTLTSGAAGSGAASINAQNAPAVLPLNANTSVTFTATDYAGNVSAGVARTVRVVDTTPPVLTCGPSVNQTLFTGTTGAAPLMPDLTALVTATDVASAVTLTQSRAVNSPLPIGASAVTITATDSSGNASTCAATITVVDNTPPTFLTVPPAAQTVQLGTAPTLAVTTADNSLNPPNTGGLVTVTNNAPATFPLGQTTVTITATDRSGNAATTTTIVTVIDTLPPVITACAPSQTVLVTSAGSTAPVPNFTTGVAATDNSGRVTVTQSPAAGVARPVGGPYPITLTATDPSGNSATCGTSFTVIFYVPKPTLAVKLNPGVLWPPNHRLVTITATITASDPSGVAPMIKLVSIVSSEPDSGLGDGDKPNDIQGAAYGTDDRVFQLRAERRGSGPGRVYTVTYSATNGAGQTVTASATVIVPHDLGGDHDHYDRGDTDRGGHNGDGEDVDERSDSSGRTRGHWHDDHLDHDGD